MSKFKGFFRIQIRKEALKFSSAHMTVFANGTKENLHGHNYRTVVKLEFERFSLSEMIPFSELKSEMRKICSEWDEHVLLPSRCPFLKIIHETDVDNQLMFAGHNAFRFADDPFYAGGFIPTVKQLVDRITTGD